MRKHLSLLTAVVSCVFVFLSCSVTRNQTPSAIGLVPLQGYAVAASQPVQDTTYLVIRNENDFATAFASSATSVKKPDFSGQMVVGLLLKSPSSLQFKGADYVGSQINVRLQSCQTAASPGCLTGSLFLATIPKVGSGKSVQFFIDSVAKGNVNL